MDTIDRVLIGIMFCAMFGGLVCAQFQIKETKTQLSIIQTQIQNMNYKLEAK